MTYDEAIDTETMVSGREAIRELSRHGFVADYDDRELFLAATSEVIAAANPDGEFSSRAIIEWLGY